MKKDVFAKPVPSACRPTQITKITGYKHTTKYIKSDILCYNLTSNVCAKIMAKPKNKDEINTSPFALLRWGAKLSEYVGKKILYTYLF